MQLVQHGGSEREATLWHFGDGPQNSNQLPQDADKRLRVKAKVQKVVAVKYIEEGPVWSLTGFFDVPKGLCDIRVAYHARECGLNAVLWAPNLLLSTVDTNAWAIDSNTWFRDTDIGKMFHNYWLDPSVQLYGGVDLVILKSKDNSTPQHGWQVQLLMGLTPSPWLNQNLPGSKTYDPQIAWVRKFNSLIQQAANDFITFYDDICVTGNGKEGCWQVMRHVVSMLNHLGERDAA
eukprot:15066232-Ditylum_brightwellii.AAC.2